jgi:hypothetical protein
VLKAEISLIACFMSRGEEGGLLVVHSVDLKGLRQRAPVDLSREQMGGNGHRKDVKHYKRGLEGRELSRI